MSEIFNVTEGHITRSPDIAEGKPCIRGRRIRVQDVYVWHEHNGLSADEIADSYNLSLSQVYAALTYAFDNLEAIRTAIANSEQVVDDIRSQYPSKLNRKDG